jgi:hypothetical protein
MKEGKDIYIKQRRAAKDFVLNISLRFFSFVRNDGRFKYLVRRQPPNRYR